jgi:hypothetical protein
LISASILLSSCNFLASFPLNIEDIDTLSVYRKYQDSITKSKKTLLLDSIHEDSLLITPPIVLPQKSSIAWVLVNGSFRIKDNAFREFEEMQSLNSTKFIIVKDSLYFVSLGQFNTKDSAKLFQKIFRKSLNQGNYLMKITSNDSIMKSLAE